MILSEIFYDPNLTQQTWHTVTCLLSLGQMLFKVVIEFIYLGIATISRDVFLIFQVFDMVSNCKNSEKKKDYIHTKIKGIHIYNYEFIKF